MAITTRAFGTTQDGQNVTMYTLTNKSGASVSMLDLGAIVTNILVPDKSGKLADVALGFDTLAHYEGGHGAMGDTIGRFANRIGGGCFTLDGTEYHLYQNDGENTLHGGKIGFQKKVWQATPVAGDTVDSVKFHYVSADMEENFPGNLTADVTISWDDDCNLTFHYQATTDKATVINMTNHTYFNLAGYDHGTVRDHAIYIDSDVVTAVEELMAGEHPEHFARIDRAYDDGERMVTTPPYTAYLKIAEGCSNGCAFCIIPKLRGRYRSREMTSLLEEARALSDAGVKELIVIAQDITRYGTDLNGEHQLARLLRELCKLDFHWIRLHYLYPDDITDELIDTIAQEKKIVPYLDIPIQHCNDGILKAMNRRDTKESIRKVFHDLRARIPGLVLRTSIIAGLPGEGEQEFEELCGFLREEKIERAGVFPFSPEEGTKAATMEHVPMEEAQRRTELLVDVQSDIIDEYNESVLGDVREVLCEGWSEEAQSYVGRSYAESVDIDGKIYFSAERDIMAGEFVNVRLTGTMDGELTGEAVE